VLQSSSIIVSDQVPQDDGSRALVMQVLVVSDLVENGIKSVGSRLSYVLTVLHHISFVDSLELPFRLSKVFNA
jgi:hypothetical protein